MYMYMYIVTVSLSMCCLLIIVCLGKYFPTPEVDVVPETIKDHDVIPQGTIIIITYINK